MTITTNTTLTEDHQGNIVIAADNVTLDCAGYMVTGSGQFAGILLWGHNGVTVRNCRSTGFFYGFVVINSWDTVFAANTASGNDASGFALDGAVGTTAVNNVARDNVNGSGFQISNSDGGVFSTNSASGNLGGFYMAGANGNRFVGNVANGSGLDGFNVLNSSNNVFERNQARNGGAQGWAFHLGSTNNTLTENAATDNQGFGFVLTVPHNQLAGNLATGNSADGFVLDGATGNVLSANSAVENAGTGFSFYNGSGQNSLTMNKAQANGGYGFVLVGAHDNEITRNLVSGNALAGIAIHTWSPRQRVRERAHVEHDLGKRADDPSAANGRPTAISLLSGSGRYTVVVGGGRISNEYYGIFTRGPMCVSVPSPIFFSNVVVKFGRG